MNGDLPAGVKVLKEGPCVARPRIGQFPGIDEGRALMQIIHDIAPGAKLAFLTAGPGQANYARAIEKLATAPTNAKVIVDDIIYHAEPIFQDGIIAQAVDQVTAKGVAYFSAAGNDTRDSYESAFRNSGVRDASGKLLHDFDPGSGVDTLQSITIPASAGVIIVFQWDQPFFS